MIKTTDNFLTKKEFNELKLFILNNGNFPWYLSNGINTLKDGEKQFYHYFYNNYSICSDFFKLLLPLLKKLKVNSLIKIKANLLPKTESIVEYKYHTDVEIKDKNLIPKTAIFYLNTNNGFTLFKDSPNVNSVENKIVYFNANLQHGGTTCTDESFRSVINFNYY
tara:strand:- start:696 stop:1190 length:495 start_codon:yes stop_codon:yes gene_type:complete